MRAGFAKPCPLFLSRFEPLLMALCFACWSLLDPPRQLPWDHAWLADPLMSRTPDDCEATQSRHGVVPAR
jgi:hypothetical protein